MRTVARTLFVSALACMFCAPAVAQTSGAREQKAREQKARTHYSKGQLHYDLGEYDEAIAEFKEAYAISPLTALLYNIAQAYRKKGDCRKALDSYATYQRLEANPPDPVLLQRQIDEMEQCSRALEAQPPPAPQPVKVTVQPAQPVGDPTAGRGLRVSGIVVGALGVAMLGGGAIAGAAAQSKAEEVQNMCGTHCSTETDNGKLAKLDSEGHALSAAATTLFVVGGSALLTGTALYYFGLRAQTSAAVALSPQPGGAMVTWAGAF